MASAAEIDFATIMPAVAKRLLGEPNPRLTTKSELRWGSNGSLCIDCEKGTYFDNEAKLGGGVIDLIRRERGCDLAGAMGWLESEGLKESAPPAQIGRRPASLPARTTRTFRDYPDATGIVRYRVERIVDSAGNKTFRQHGPDGRGGFHTRKGCMSGVEPLPYRLPDFADADPSRAIFVVEGEKDADRLADLGLLATTNSGGAGKFPASIAPFFQDRRIVVIGDNDEAGERHVRDVITKLREVAAVITALPLDGLPPKGDVSDWLDAGHTVDELKSLAAAALDSPIIPDEEHPETLPLADLELWSVTQPTPKSFIWAGRIPEREVTIFTGPGGANKSTLGQQLATCCAADKPMLSIETAQRTALYVTAEDDEDRLHWLQDHICRAVGIRISDLVSKLHLASVRGRINNELATFDADGKIRLAPAFTVLKATLTATGAKLLVLDNAAHFFAGSENDRGQVTAFINALYSLCLDLGVTVVLIAHQNKAGDTYSGSTAWLNAVRSQLVIGRPEGGFDPDERVLTVGKANYARPDEILKFRWHDFALILDDDLPADRRAEIAATAKASAENDAFMACLRERNGQGEGRGVGPSPGPNYAPSQFEGMAAANGFTKVVLKRAMDRLFATGRIESVTVHNKAKSREVTVIREVDLGFPNAFPNASRTLIPNPPEPLPEPARAHTVPLKGKAGAALKAAAPDLSRPVFGADDDDPDPFDVPAMNGGGR